MAQKQFKIGLSNTDKQNMSQDVYERVLALTFAEYDSANTYNKGDFVVYEDTLYQCKQDNTTGAWDSSKWQQATLQDLLNDIEGAVAFVNDKANVDGNYPTMTVGAADNLTPYDEDSGVDQEQPFLLQGTGCGNGEQQVDTGALGLLKEKQGNTVVVNQKFDSANAGRTHCTVSNGLFTVSAAGSVTASVTKTAIQGHKYLLISKYNMVLNGEGIYTIAIGLNGQNQQIIASQTTNREGLFCSIIEKNSTFNGTAFSFFAWTDPLTTDLTGSTFTCNIIDLTQWFNGDIPADIIANPSNFFRYYQGSLAYNEGTLVNANGRYLKTIGRNQWDEEWELGDWYLGEKVAGSNNTIRCKNPVKVIPNATYNYYNVGGYSLYTLEFLDKDLGYISRQSLSSGSQFVIPSNCEYIVFTVQSSYGTTYNHDITISIYYEDESGYDQYYPYEESANIDTGTEVLRSAGSVKDSKAPDGTITRRIGYVDLSTVTFSFATLTSGGAGVFYATISGKKQGIGNLISNKYNYQETPAVNMTVDGIRGDENDGTIYICSSQTSGTITGEGTLYYELATSTTEQGTTFSENVAIDDFGSMDFGGTNGVPQGASIFYPVDYKAFIDSLYNTLDGDATDVVKDSELDSKLATLGYVKLTSVSGYDATKTQVLKNVEGTLTWVTEE